MKRPTTDQEVRDMTPHEQLALFNYLFANTSNAYYPEDAEAMRFFLRQHKLQPTYKECYRGSREHANSRYYAGVEHHVRVGDIRGHGFGDTPALALLEAAVSWKIQTLEYNRAKRKAARDE